VNLERALELAERGRGTTHPNPVVGAVVVRDGEVVGEGWHERKGGPHAEIAALAAAGDRARGATLYVSMEPCAHHGSTPPCTEAIIAAGVAKVVAGSLDPNPEARGGFDVLRAAGVEVENADLFAARVQNEAWRVWVSEGRPFVNLKLAVTLDGRVAVPGARWISGEESRRRVHELRAQVDAVAVGMGTVRADNPELTARDVGAERQPRRLAFGRGPAELEVRSGPLREERSVTAARRRPDARRCLPPGRPRRQADAVRRASHRWGRDPLRAGAGGADRATSSDRRAARRGPAPDRVRSRAQVNRSRREARELVESPCVLACEGHDQRGHLRHLRGDELQ
jgi:diaminohydroxyphosphoribosylaminopyrimidine deaminase/5-amino-6-(5-phosphoribosylamino)uracil reductase